MTEYWTIVHKKTFCNKIMNSTHLRFCTAQKITVHNDHDVSFLLMEYDTDCFFLDELNQTIIYDFMNLTIQS